MKIKQIKVEKLFGLENNNFNIECYPNEYVTILYAFNGVGKTTLLRLIDAVLGVKMQILDSIAFKKIEIYFDNDDIIVAEKLGDYKNKFIETRCKDLYFSDTKIPTYPVKFTVKTNKKVSEYYLRLSEGFTEQVKKNPESTVGEIKEVKGIKLKKRTNAVEDGENINLAGENMSYIESRPVNSLLFEYDAYIFFDWNDLCIFQYELFPEIVHKFYSHLILANKQFEVPPRGEYDPRYEIFRNYSPTIDDYYITDEQFKTICYYRNLLEKEKRTLEFEQQIPIGIDKTKEICGTFKAILKEDKFSKKLELYHNLLNEKFGFLYKTIEFDEHKGLKVVPIYKGDFELDVMKLSAGEKKLIILLYSLLFESESARAKEAQSIILIDEPETSLHIEWQSHIVECILEICEKFCIQVIITTHSPEIVGEYDELTTKIISERFKYEQFFKIQS